jgi:taurine dioxygenase
MKLTELSASLGMVVQGVDTREPLTPEQITELRETFDRSHLLLFRDQQLTGTQQVELAGHFGPIAPEKSGPFGYVSNVRADAVVPEGALPFHSDFAFTDEPVHGLSLHALEVPGNGAPTRFADAVCALDRMPPELRARIKPLRVLNVYDFKLPTDRRMRASDISPGSPCTERSFVGPHPRTGTPVINANEMHTDRVLGLTPDASEVLLAEVYAVLYGDANVYEHRWEVGDVLVWDNIALHHGRHAFPVDEPRTLQRVCLNPKTSHELVPNLEELLR